MTSTVRRLKTAQRHAIVGFAAVVPALLALILSDGFAHPVALTVWAIAQGTGVAWIGTAAWDGRERWAARAQVTLVGLFIVTLINPLQDASVAAVGLVVFTVAALLLHFAHIMAQSLHDIQAHLATVRGLARTQAARQTLYFLTFAAPLTLGVAPNIYGAVLLAVSGAVVHAVTVTTARRRVQRGLIRGGVDA